MVRTGVLLAALGASLTGAENPIVKVIQLLEDSQTKVKTMQAEKDNLYAKDMHTCKNKLKEFNGDIETHTNTVNDKTEEIAGLTADIEALTASIDKLTEDGKTAQANNVKLNMLQQKQKLAQQETQTDLEQTITAIKAAITAINSKKVDKKGVASLLEARSSSTSIQKKLDRALWLADTFLTHDDRRRMQALIQAEPEVGKEKEIIDKATRDEKVVKYKWQSGGIVEMLEGLQEKFEAELMDNAKQQQRNTNAGAVSAQANKNQMIALVAELGEQKGLRTTAEQEKKAAETTLSGAKSDLADSETDLEQMTTSCDAATRHYESNKEDRSNELVALEKAIEILKESLDIDLVNKKDEAAASGFIQISDPVKQVAAMLKSSASVHRSRELANIASAVLSLSAPYKGWDTDAAKGPFHKVKQMMEKMIFRLNEEQNSDNDQYRWCEKEFKATNYTLHSKTKRIGKLDNEITALDTEIGQLKNSIKLDKKSLKDEKKSLKDLTDEREVKHKENTVAIEDAVEGGEALANALGVLNQFFDQQKTKKFDAVEGGHADGPTAETAHTSAGHEAIISMLETVESNFNKAESDNRAQEESELDQFKQDESKSKIKQSKLDAKINAETGRKDQLSKKKHDTENRRSNAAEDKEASMTYWVQLAKPCMGAGQEGNAEAEDFEWVDAASSSTLWDKIAEAYQNRTDARSDEIEGLQKAQKTLKAAFNKVDDGKKGFLF